MKRQLVLIGLASLLTIGVCAFMLARHQKSIENKLENRLEKKNNCLCGSGNVGKLFWRVEVLKAKTDALRDELQLIRLATVTDFEVYGKDADGKPTKEVYPLLKDHYHRGEEVMIK